MQPDLYCTLNKLPPPQVCERGVWIRPCSNRHQKLSGMVWIAIRYVTHHFRDRRGAASLRYRNRAEITVLMCESIEALSSMARHILSTVKKNNSTECLFNNYYNFSQLLKLFTKCLVNYAWPVKNNVNFVGTLNSFCAGRKTRLLGLVLTQNVGGHFNGQLKLLK